jgi:hypothetical protein
MNDKNIASIAQLKSFLKEVAVINFSINNIGNKNKQEMYDWVDTVTQKFRYFSFTVASRTLGQISICDSGIPFGQWQRVYQFCGDETFKETFD